MELVKQKSPEGRSSTLFMLTLKISGLPILRMFNKEQGNRETIMNSINSKMQSRRLMKWQRLLTRLK